MTIDLILKFKSLSAQKKFLVALLSIVILTVIILLLMVVLKRYSSNFKASEAVRQQQLSLKKAEEIRQAVEKLIELPDEDPTVATINDLSKLQGQPFFSKAEEGDIVLFFTKAQKAFLYRPAANKIIDVAGLETQN